jgi:ABC-type branched-subunit amino acid transport system ATPase component
MTTGGRLEIENVSKSFGGLHAVDGCSFDVSPGSLMGFIGPNGAGKSTLFNLISGIYQPSAGSIRLNGEELIGLRPDQVAAMGMSRTFQTPRSFGTLSCLENMLASSPSPGEKLLAAVLGTYRSHEREVAAEARQLLGLVGLGARADHPADELSGGELRMLEVARQLIRHPKILLLDEPTAGVNPRLQTRLADLLRTLHAEGLTVLVVEHNLGFLLDLVDQVVVMVRGKVLTEGPPDSIRRDPGVINAYLGRQDGDAA